MNNSMIGMLWFDNSTRTSIEQKIIEAARYYGSKYGQAPNCCHISITVKDAPAHVTGIKVKPDPTVSPGYFWIGVD
jgi:hypothetical protein